MHSQHGVASVPGWTLGCWGDAGQMSSLFPLLKGSGPQTQVTWVQIPAPPIISGAISDKRVCLCGSVSPLRWSGTCLRGQL